jgi:hypothetical protein
MKKLLFVLLFALSSIASAEPCKTTAVRLAMDLNNMHMNGATVRDVKKRFNYNKDLAELASIYMSTLVDAKPAGGWTGKEYTELAIHFAKLICERKE